MVLTISSLALLATGLKAVTWTWFSFKAIKLACKLGKSINLEAKKGRQPLPKFKSGRVEKFYKGTTKHARPRFSRNNDILAQRRMEAIMEGSNVTLTKNLNNNVDKKVKKSQEPVEVKEEIEEKMIHSMVMNNFSECNDDCDCSNATEDASEASLTTPEDIATIADVAAKELNSLWRNEVALDSANNFTSIKARNNESMNCSLASSGEESQDDCHCSAILETPVKHDRVKDIFDIPVEDSHAKEENNSNIFEGSIIGSKNSHGEFETLRNSTPATFPGIKCDFNLSFKIPKVHPPKSKLIKQPHALQLLEELPEQSPEASYSDYETQFTEMMDNEEATDQDTTPILNRKFRADAQQISDGQLLNETTRPHIRSCSASPPLRKPRAYRMKRVTEKDFSDIVYDKIVKSAKRNISVDLTNVLGVYENSKEKYDFLKTGGSISSKEISLKLTADKDSSDLEAVGAMEAINKKVTDVDYTDPLRVWTPSSESVIPSWNKQLLPSEAMPQSMETPPSPPKIDKSLLTCLDNFEEEQPKPTAIDKIITEEDELKAVEGLGDVDEVMVNYDNFAIIRTTPAAIRKSSRGEDMNENIGDCQEKFDSFNSNAEDVFKDLIIVENEEDINVEDNAPMEWIDDVKPTTEKTVDATSMSETNPEHNITVDSEEKRESFQTARKKNDDVNISFGVSYDLISVDSKGESQADVSGTESDTYNNTTKEVSISGGSQSNSSISDCNVIYKFNGNDNDEDISLLTNYEGSSNGKENEDNDDVILVSVKGDSAFLSNTLPLMNIKREDSYSTEEVKEQLRENVHQTNQQPRSQEFLDEIIIISDDDEDHVKSMSPKCSHVTPDISSGNSSTLRDQDSQELSGSQQKWGESTPEGEILPTVSSLERSIVTDLRLSINQQFQVEEADE